MADITNATMGSLTVLNDTNESTLRNNFPWLVKKDTTCNIGSLSLYETEKLVIYPHLFRRDGGVFLCFLIMKTHFLYINRFQSCNISIFCEQKLKRNLSECYKKMTNIIKNICSYSFSVI